MKTKMFQRSFLFITLLVLAGLWMPRLALADWPVVTGDSVFSSPVLGDLDDDGELEIVVASWDGNIYALNPDGSSLPGWPVNVGGSPNSSPALGDIDDDGELEVVIGVSNSLRAYDADGSELWVGGTNGTVESSPAIGDLDGDGSLEIVVGDVVGKVYAFNGTDGSPVGGSWPFATGDGITFCSPALGDLDGDGQLEIVIGSHDGNVYVLNADGTERWQQPTGDWVNSSPALGDINGDGNLEIVVGSNDGNVYAWDAGGNTLAGWPYTTGGAVYSSPALADLDGDGLLEIVVGSYDNNVHVLDYEANPIATWPTGSFVQSSPAIGDIDCDGELEVVVGSWDNGVYAFNLDGTQVDGWPMVTGNMVFSSPAIGDIDDDGNVEVVCGSHDGNIYCWEVPCGGGGSRSADMSLMPWPMFRHDMHHTGRFGEAVPSMEAPVVLIPYVSDSDQPPYPSEEIFPGFDGDNYCAPVAVLNIIDYLICHIGHPSAIGVDAGLDWNNVAAYLGYFMDTNDDGFREDNPMWHPGTCTKDIEPGLREFVRWDEDNSFGEMDLPEGKKGYDWTVNTSYTDFHAYKAEIDCGRPVLLDFRYWNPILTELPPIEYIADWYTERIDIYDFGDEIDRASANNPENPEERWNLESGEECIGHTVTGVGYIEDYDPDGDGPMDAKNYLIVHDNWWTTEHSVAIPWHEVNAIITIMPCAYECASNPGDVSGDGSVSPYDAALILQFVVGLIDELPINSTSPSDTSTLRNYTVSAPNLKTTQGSKIQASIIIDDAAGLTAGGIILKYDATVLKPTQVAPLLSGTYWKANTNIAGEVRFAFATTEPTSGKENLLMIEFEALPNTEGQASPLILDTVQLSGSSSIAKINGMVTILPPKSLLLQNYPNPFNPETWIPFKLATDSPVMISIYNAKGQVIRTIFLGTKQAGVYINKAQAAYWDGRDSFGQKVASGLYFYNLQAGEFAATRKMVIMK